METYRVVNDNPPMVHYKLSIHDFGTEIEPSRTTVKLKRGRRKKSEMSELVRMSSETQNGGEKCTGVCVCA
jgi:hypothetical protein